MKTEWLEMWAKVWDFGHGSITTATAQNLEAFATMVEDAQAKRMFDEGMVTTGMMRERIDQAIKTEREACAKVCEKQDTTQYPRTIEDEHFSTAAAVCAAAIRARTTP